MHVRSVFERSAQFEQADGPPKPAPWKSEVKKPVGGWSRSSRTSTGSLGGNGGNVANILCRFDSAKRQTMTSRASITSSFSSSSSSSSLSLPVHDDMEKKTLPPSPPPPPCPNAHVLERVMDELLGLYQSAVDECSAAQIRITELESKLERTADATQIRDYELRVDYLTDKLEKISKERDSLEKELSCNNQSKDKVPQVDPLPDLISFEKQLAACEEGAYRMAQTYMGDLEKQKLESRRLCEVVLKQSELIRRLETKIDTLLQPPKVNLAVDDLLQAQMELQCAELEDKRILLSALLTEREVWMEQMEPNKPNRMRSHSAPRSSIDILTRMAHSDAFIASPPSQLSLRAIATHRKTAPPTAPPRSPLPPLPSHKRSSSSTPYKSSPLSASPSFSSLCQFGSQGSTSNPPRLTSSSSMHSIASTSPSTKSLRKTSIFWNQWKHKLSTSSVTFSPTL
ncbi:hypothetical protein CLU79DRAFT_719683 [Phycomyces nitens]|nr:hypothetical protein CLU79DRAFT_719683 [Phycomyces nitens]